MIVALAEEQQKQEESHCDNMEGTPGLWALDYNCHVASVYIHGSASLIALANTLNS